MREYQFHTGGRHLTNEDIENLQNLALANSEMMNGAGLNFCLSGCTVTETTVQRGYVFLDKKIRSVNTTDVSKMTFPIFIIPQTENSEIINYLDGSTGLQYIDYTTAIIGSEDEESLPSQYIKCETPEQGFPGFANFLELFTINKNATAEQEVASAVVFKDIVRINECEAEDINANKITTNEININDTMMIGETEMKTWMSMIETRIKNLEDK